MKALYRATVTTQSDPLRVRYSPVTGHILGRVPRGQTVDVLVDNWDGWPYIRYGDLAGYVSGEYLQRIDSEEPDNPEQAHPPDTGGQSTEASPLPSDGASPGSGASPIEAESLRIPLADAQAIYEALGEAQRLIGAALGVD